MEKTVSQKSFRLETLILILLGAPCVFRLLGFIPAHGTFGQIYHAFIGISAPVAALTICCLMLKKKTELKTLAKIGVILMLCAYALSTLQAICWQVVWNYIHEYDLHSTWSIIQTVYNVLFYLIWIPGIVMLSAGSDIKKGLKILLFIIPVVDLFQLSLYPVANWIIGEYLDYSNINFTTIYTWINIFCWMIDLCLFLAAIFLSGITKRKAAVAPQPAAEEIKAASCEVIESADEATAEEATVETEVAAEPAIEEETVVVEEQVNEEKPVAE